MASDVILRTTGLGKRFGKRWAVRGLDLAVHKGEIFGFLGPNGAGKSTTIRMILSLIRPTEGSVQLFGKELSAHRGEILGRVGGLVERADFYRYLSGRRNLQIVGTLKGGASRSEIDDVLRTVGLLDRAEEKVKAYSHGMKQRLGIAQALLGKPELIILDEPTTGLDPQGIKEVRILIRQLAEDRGITIFLSSHLLSEIEQLATSVAIINLGATIVQGAVSDLLGSHGVTIDARPIDRAEQLLRSHPAVSDIVRTEEGLAVHVAADDVPAVNAMLVGAGLEVYAISPRRSLEQYFLSITEGASEVRSSGTGKGAAQ